MLNSTTDMVTAVILLYTQRYWNTHIRWVGCEDDRMVSKEMTCLVSDKTVSTFY